MSSRPAGREGDPDLQEIAWLAAEIGAAPVALVVLCDGMPAAFHVAARVGAGAPAAAGASGMALRIVQDRSALVVPDLEADPRTCSDAAIAPPLQARALAGAPIGSPGAAARGALMVFDLEPRPFLPWQVGALERLARLAGRRLEQVEGIRARDLRRDQTLGALAGGLALEIQALQAERWDVAGGGGGTLLSAAALARAASLARDLLALCGHRSQRPASVDLNALVTERASRVAESCGRRLDIRLDRTIGPVAADGERLGRAIAGLVSRAALAPRAAIADAGGALRLATSEVAIAAGPPAPLPAGRYVVLTIGEPDGFDRVRGWSFEAGGAMDADGLPESLAGLAEMRGMLRQSGARLGTAVGVSGRPAFCIALPRAAD